MVWLSVVCILKYTGKKISERSEIYTRYLNDTTEFDISSKGTTNLIPDEGPWLKTLNSVASFRWQSNLKTGHILNFVITKKYVQR